MSLLRDFLVAPRVGEGAVGDGASGAGQAVGDGASGAGHAVGDGASGAGQVVGDGASGAGQAVGDGASGAGQVVGDGASGAGQAVGDGARRRATVEDRAPRRSGRARFASSSAAAPALGVLAPPRELSVATAGVGLAIGGSAPAVLVCLAAPVFAPALRAPPRAAAARLAASLRARGFEAVARGRLALVHLPGEGRTDVVTRALAVAGSLPTVLAVAGRDDEVDALLATRDAMLVALPSSAEPALVALALAGASALVPAAAALTLTLDPVQRALALAGVRPPRTISAAVRQLVD